MAKDKTYMAEIPRIFIGGVKGRDEEEAREGIKTIMNRFIDKYAMIQDVTNKKVPTLKEATTTESQGPLERAVRTHSMGENVSKTGATGFLGIGGADVFFNDWVYQSLGIDPGDNFEGEFLGLNDYFTSRVDTETNAFIPNQTADINDTTDEDKENVA